MGWGGFDDNPISKKIEDEANNVSKGNVSGVATGVLTQGHAPAIQVAGKAAGDAVGMGHGKQDELNAQSSGISANEAAANRGVLNSMKGADDEYLARYRQQIDKQRGSFNNNSQGYLGDIERNKADAQEQAKSAKSTYSNDIQPRLKSTMEDAQREAGSAMTLAQAGDPNNQVHTAVRGMYDQQARGVQKQGLADYGVLAALGSQATQNTASNSGPMTGAQTQLLSANNNRQASQAYSIAAQRMNDLKQQGLDRGFEESDKQYNRGQGAKDRYERSIGNYEGGMDRDIARQQGFRDIDMGYSSDRYGVQNAMANNEYAGEMGYENARHGFAGAQGNRDLGQIGQEYGNQQAAVANQMAAANAENAQKAGIAGGIFQGAGTVLGAMYGGQGGAQAGNSAGGAVRQGMGGYQTPPQNQAYNRPQYGYA